MVWTRPMGVWLLWRGPDLIPKEGFERVVVVWNKLTILILTHTIQYIVYTHTHSMLRVQFQLPTIVFLPNNIVLSYRVF